jgi:soluble lytic murein transglycosylase-like protein
MRALFLCLCAIPAFAGEYAVLSNGFRVHADRHEKRGDRIRLETQAGSMELSADSVVAFEAEEYTPPTQTPGPVAAVTFPKQKPVRSSHELVEAAAHKAELPPAIVHAVARAESGYRQDAISRKGAIGVMQLMPATAKGLQADPYDAEQNTQAGAQYLRDLLVKYKGDVPKALAAYNAGPGAVDKYGAVPPYAETRSYVNRVISNYRKLGGE